ncbi:MAG: nuclear transport factor 2 family protein [Chloroflexota bacterium]
MNVDSKKTYTEILTVNTKFYQALQQADFDVMATVWAHRDMVECIHPGWDRLQGWDAVADSWDRIFQNQGPLPIQVTKPVVHWRGEMAWVICYERISIQVGANFQVSQTVATNVFEYIDQRWKMIIHHASPIPSRQQTWSGALN